MAYIIFIFCAALLLVTGLWAMAHIDRFFGYDQSEDYPAVLSRFFDICARWCIIVKQQEERHGTGKKKRRAENLF